MLQNASQKLLRAAGSSSSSGFGDKGVSGKFGVPVGIKCEGKDEQF
ncbi:MAG: hypothetical protein KBE18_03280 [Synergistaceae bacterium]|nr:hypothetical protein [Synergistaceae bacterium]